MPHHQPSQYGEGQTVDVPVAVTVALAFLMGATAFAVDASIPAIPATAQFFGAELSTVQLTVGLYMLGYATGQIPMGFLSDAFGRRPVVLICMSLFVLMGLSASMASSMPMLLASRFLQGLFGASGAVLSRAIARDITTGVSTARLMSLLTGTIGFVMILAPMIGAVALLALGWRAPFAASSLLGFMGVVMVWRFVPESRPATVSVTPFERLRRGAAAFFASRQSVVCAVLVGGAFSGLIAFVTLSSSVFIVEFGISEIAFALVYGAVSAGYMAGSLTARRLLLRIPAKRLAFGIALSFGIGAVAAFLILAFEALGFWIVLSLCVFLFVCIGAMLSVATAIAMEPLAATAGMGAALLGTIQLLFGAIVSVGVARIDYNSLTLLLAVFGVSSAGVMLVSLSARFDAK